MKKALLTLILILLLMPAAQGASLTAPESWKPFAEDHILYTPSADGTLTLRVHDEYIDYTISTQAVSADTPIDITWDARMENGEPLRRGTYTLSAVLNTESDVLTEEMTLSVKKAARALEYVIPSADVLYAGYDGYRVHYLLTASGTVRIRAYSAEDTETPLRSWSYVRDDLQSHQFQWNGTVNDKKLPAGEYILTFEAVDGCGDIQTVPVTILDCAPPSKAIALTDNELYLPSDMTDDAAVWQALMSPIVVADVNKIKYINIYAEATSRSQLLAKAHGQSVGLKILETDVGGFAKVAAWCGEGGSYVEGYVKQSALMTVYPNTHYGLVVDKNAQTLTVYMDGVKLGVMKVTTGLMIKNDKTRETRAGAFITLDRFPSFVNDGRTYHYAIRTDGGTLIHSVGTDIRSNKWDYTIELPLLGHKASHGCVRVNPNVQEDGLNMYWLWTHIPYGVKVLIIDDPEAREQRLVELADSSLNFLPLTYGSKDSHVKNLQNLLKDLDLLKGKPDGVYGALTRDAVLTFQQNEGLPCTGICDTQTWLLLKKRCSAL